MGASDKKQKNYFEDPERFADVWNTLFFRGKEIDWHDLQEGNAVITYTGSHESVEKIADMVMKKTKDGKMLALYMMENQMLTDYSMPARACIEEVLAYDKQLREIKRRNKKQMKWRGDDRLCFFQKEDKLRPVTTLVLYWGDKPWDGALTLEEMIDFTGAEELKGYVPQYQLHLVNMSKVENIEAFQTDMRSVVECFQRRNDKKRFVEYMESCDEKYELDSAGMQVLSSLVQSKELKRYLSTKNQKGRKDTKMCRAITELIEDGRQEGIGIGRQEGIGIGRQEGIGIGRQEGIGIGRQEGIGIGRQEGIGIGRQEGIADGRILEFIKVRREDGYSDEEIFDAIKSRYALTQKKAEEMMNSGEFDALPIE